MMFRNLTFFRFPSNLGGTAPAEFASFWDQAEVEEGASFEVRPSHIEECLRAEALKPVGPLEMASRGFVSPYGQFSELFVQRIGQAALVTLGGEDKILPAAVVNDLLQKKLVEIEQREGRSPGGRTRKQIKQDLVAELLPKAFVQPYRLDAYFDLQRHFIAVDTASRRGAESIVSHVRHAIGSFPALPLNAEVAPRAILTTWLAGADLPDSFSLGDECELRDPSDNGAVVKVQRLELSAEEIQQHLESGMQCTRLALVLDDCVSFVFGEDLVVRKLKLLDGAIDKLESQDREDVTAELDARFALLSGEVGRLFDLLEAAFRLTNLSQEST